MRHPALATLECFYLVRFRKLIGAVALFVLVLAWTLIAMAVARFPAVRDTTVLSILYYVIAGCGLGVAGNAPTSHTTNINGITLWILEA